MSAGILRFHGVVGIVDHILDIQDENFSRIIAAGIVGGSARLKNFLIKALGGPEFEVNGELSGSKKKTEQLKGSRSMEQKLAHLTTVLNRMGEPVYFSNLGVAARHADSNGSTVFVDIEDEFSAPQFQSWDGASSVNRAGYLVLEKGGVSDYEYGDGYYEAPSRPVTLSESLLKMPTSAGGMAITGHDPSLF